jgi:hypothetical protein
MEIPHFSKIQAKLQTPQITQEDIESLKVQIAKELNDVLAGRLTPFHKNDVLSIHLGTFLSSTVNPAQKFRPIVEWLHDAGYTKLSWDSDPLRSFPSKEMVILKIHLNLLGDK